MLIKREKLYQGKYFDLRDYELKEAHKRGEDIVCIYGNKGMTLTPENQIKRRNLFNKTPFRSKINPDQTYYIYSFLFEPDRKLTQEEEIKEMSQLGVFG